jgi:GTP pyrophosphokinase
LSLKRTRRSRRNFRKQKRERSRYINEFIRPIREKLEKAGFDFEIYGRPKSIHSIWNKILKKGVEFEEVYDLFAIRVILNAPPEKEKEDCWKVYSLLPMSTLHHLSAARLAQQSEIKWVRSRFIQQ